MDAVLSRVLDVVWAFPVYLLGDLLSVVLLTSGLQLGPVTVDGRAASGCRSSIIAAIYVPVRRPAGARAGDRAARPGVHPGGDRPRRARPALILRREVLPNVVPTVIVFFPLMTALNMLTESALSFLSVGVQPPDASWGTIINDGLGLLYTRPAVAIAPGLLIALTAVALNVLGDGVRDALDPGARLRGGVR